MSISATPKKPVNLTLDTNLLAEARAFRVNLSQAIEAGLRRAAAETRKRENRVALDSSNARVERHGLPLDRFRQF